MIEQDVAYQPGLVLEFPIVQNNKDYEEYCKILNRIDELLSSSGIELEFTRSHVGSMLERKRQETNDPNASLTHKELKRHSRYAVRALRCNIVGILLGEPLRGLSLRIAESFVLQRFCQVGDLCQVEVPSKSQLWNYRNTFDLESVQAIIDQLIEQATAPSNVLGLRDPLETTEVYIDCTCLESNIHFPVDWLLLRDGVRTLIKSILVIRRHGLRHRIGNPKGFLREINHLCIEMNNCRRQKGAAKARKSILRKMKKVSQVVEAHGHRYIKLLEEKVSESDLSANQARQIITRLQRVLDQLPEARKQAHRRIIGEEKLADDEKIISLYDDQVGVIKRGKGHAEVEFGNELFLAEQANGLIVDWKLYAGQPPADSNKIPDFLERLEAKAISADDLCSDRGFFSAKNKALIEQKAMSCFLCPRNPATLKAAMQDDVFRLRQCRRAQTEARVGIVKNCFTGNPAGSRIFTYRERQCAWAILTHNLWVVARLPKAADRAQRTAA